MARRVLICGFGAFGALHARAWRRVDARIDLMVADPSDAARASAAEFGIAPDNLAADAAALLNRADLVDIVAPARHHAGLALLALQAEKPVLLEKPAVTTLDEAQRIMAAAGRTPLQVGYVLRAHPLVQTAAQILAADGIGALLSVEGDFSGWKRMRSDSTLLENDGVHFLDLMAHLAQAPITSVAARSWRMLDPAIEDEIILDTRMRGDIRGRLRLGVLNAGATEDPFVPGALTTKTLRLIGDGGNLLLDFNRNSLTHAAVTYARTPGGFDPQPQSVTTRHALNISPEGLLARSFRIFLHAVDGGSPVMCDARQGVLDMAQILAATDQSLRQQDHHATQIEGGS